MGNDKTQEAPVSSNGNKEKRLLVKLFPIKFILDNTSELVYAFVFLAIFAVTGLIFFGYITRSFYDIYHFTLWLYLVPLIIGLGFLHGADKTFGVIPTALLMFGTVSVLYAVVGLFAGSGLNLFIPLFYESLVFAIHVTSLYLAVYLVTYKKLNLRFKVIRTGEGFDKFTKLLEDMGFGKRMPDSLRGKLKDSRDSPI
jgi:hypothetical protein